MTDWLDPFGMFRVADALTTGAAQTMVGRMVRLEAQAIEGRVRSVDQAAPANASPANAISNMLAGQIGLWRRLEVTFGEVQVGAQTISEIRVEADDVRAVEALPQRVQARALDVQAHLTPEEVGSWLADIAPPDVGVRIEGGRVLARLPRLARFGDVELEPRWDGRTVGIDVRFAWVRGRQVGLPDRFRRSYERELDWFPPRTAIQSIGIGDDGSATISASITDYVINVDVPRLMADLTAKGTAGAIDVLLGGPV